MTHQGAPGETSSDFQNPQGYCVVDGGLRTRSAQELATAFEHIWGGENLITLAEADRRFRADRLLPDAILVADGGPSSLARGQSLTSTETLLATARRSGLDLPCFRVAPCAADILQRSNRSIFLTPDCPPKQLIGRIRATLREAVRLEEAILRRRCLGWAAAPADAEPGMVLKLLIIGNSELIGQTQDQPGLSFDLIGALSPDQAIAQLSEQSVAAVVLDVPRRQAEDALIHIRRDPRYASLPVLAIAATPADAEVLWECGASDVLSRPVDPQMFAARLGSLLRAGARARLASAALKRERNAHLNQGLVVRADRFAVYLKALTQRLAFRGARPVQRRLADLHEGPRARHVANDPDLTRAVGDPVRSALLTASRDEDFIATVEGYGDIAVLRSDVAAERLAQRIAAIVGRTSFT